MRRKMLWAGLAAICCAVLPAAGPRAGADGPAGVERRGDVRSVTIPVTLRIKEKSEAEIQYLEGLEVFEDGERQEILTTRGGPRSPLTLAVLIQDDLVSSVANEIAGLKDFIRGLPPGSRVMIGYMRSGSMQVRQKFTADLERASRALRIPAGSSALAPFNPFSQTRDAVKRFESQPVGRRAVLVVSDGIDLSRGVEGSTPSGSVDLQRAIDEAQRNGVAVYTLYAPTGYGQASMLVNNGQSSLDRLARETGGYFFAQGTGAPVSFDRFLTEISQLLSRQFALTYLSTHPEKGFHRLRVVAEVSGGKLHHPTGYRR
jgi:VWFA-related protein